MLNEKQHQAARDLLACRPAVIEGTRSILSTKDAGLWHAKVSDSMRANEVSNSHDVEKFCDIAGVAD